MALSPSSGRVGLDSRWSVEAVARGPDRRRLYDGEDYIDPRASCQDDLEYALIQCTMGSRGQGSARNERASVAETPIGDQGSPGPAAVTGANGVVDRATGDPADPAGPGAPQRMRPARPVKSPLSRTPGIALIAASSGRIVDPLKRTSRRRFPSSVTTGPSLRSRSATRGSRRGREDSRARVRRHRDHLDRHGRLLAASLPTSFDSSTTTTKSFAALRPPSRGCGPLRRP